MSANVTFQDVIDEVMLEETEPTYQALVHWQKLYPKWRDSLAEYFAEWALDKTLDKTQTPEAPADIDGGIDEDTIVEKTMEYVMYTLARQGRLIPENSSEPLRPLDRMVLAAIVELQGRAEAVHVSDWVDNTAGKSVSLGAIFSPGSRPSWSTRSARPSTGSWP